MKGGKTIEETICWKLLKESIAETLKVKEYISSDEAIPVERDGVATEMLYPPEYLNTFKFPGLPPNIVKLKIGVPIMMMWNMNLGCGLCNGTRMIVKNWGESLYSKDPVNSQRSKLPFHF